MSSFVYAHMAGRQEQQRLLARNHAFLQGLRSGRLRLAGLPARLRGSSFARIREHLAALDFQHLAAVEASLQSQIATLPDRGNPLQQTETWLEAARQRGLARHGEAALLEYSGFDRYGRRHWLQPAASRALSRLRHAAALDGVDLELISSFRSVRDQLRILMRKHVSGQSWEQILIVNAPPGYSEHHSGCAVDFAVPGAAVLTEVFESTVAFEWLQHSAARFGFELSYPRGNRWGFVYEPWHWCFRG